MQRQVGSQEKQVASDAQDVDAIACAIFNTDGEILVVRRPHNDPSLPGVWGLPSTKELHEQGRHSGLYAAWHDDVDTVRRIGEKKLGLASLQVIGFFGELEQDGMSMRLYEAAIAPTTQRLRLQTTTENVTGFVDMKWSNPAILEDARAAGSVCCQLFLQHYEPGSYNQDYAYPLDTERDTPSPPRD